MKVAGFSFIKNAIRFGYPICEAIQSILPICDRFYVAIGDCSDDTRALVAAIDPKKVCIIDTVWDDTLREGGVVLASETDKALAAIPEGEFDWCFYIQGDEMLHEQYLLPVQQAMLQWKDDEQVDGLLFNYLHFYGSFDYVGNSTKWYDHEIRVIRSGRKIYSYRDAQGFRKNNNQKLNVKQIPAFIYHYGWVRPPKIMQAKTNQFYTFWSPELPKEPAANDQAFDYNGIDSLVLFTGTHPKVMQDRIAQQNWTFHWDMSYNNLSLKEKFKNWCAKWLGYKPFVYRNYKKI